MQAFFQRICFDTHCAGAEKQLGRDVHDRICAIHTMSLRGRRETREKYMSRNRSFRVFANQEFHKRIGHRQPWTFIRGACIARRWSRSTLSVKIRDRTIRGRTIRGRTIRSGVLSLCAAYQSVLTCDIGFHSKLCISPLCVFCQRVYLCPGTYYKILFNSDIYEIQTCALSILVIQFTILLFLLSLLSRIHYSSLLYYISSTLQCNLNRNLYFVILRVSC